MKSGKAYYSVGTEDGSRFLTLSGKDMVPPSGDYGLWPGEAAEELAEEGSRDQGVKLVTRLYGYL